MSPVCDQIVLLYERTFLASRIPEVKMTCMYICVSIRNIVAFLQYFRKGKDLCNSTCCTLRPRARRCNPVKSNSSQPQERSSKGPGGSEDISLLVKKAYMRHILLTIRSAVKIGSSSRRVVGSVYLLGPRRNTVSNPTKAINDFIVRHKQEY